MLFQSLMLGVKKKINYCTLSIMNVSDEGSLFLFSGRVVSETRNKKLGKSIGALLWKDSRYSMNNGDMLLQGFVEIELVLVWLVLQVVVVCLFF